MRGTIKWYSEHKRIGWIVLDSGEEIYVHFSALRFPPNRRPQPNEPVTFEVVVGPGGKQARNVKPAGPQRGVTQ